MQNQKGNYAKSVRQTLQSRAYETLRKAILNGYLRPSQRLTEIEISNQLKISRTPVREALLFLSREGLVQRLSSGGFAIAPFDRKDAKETCELRKALELFAIEIAVRNLTKIEIKRLEKNLNEQKKAIKEGFVEKIAESFMEFDKIIYDSCGSKVLTRALEAIRDRIYLYGVMVLRHNKKMEHAIQNHSEIIKALEEKNLVRAKKVISDHINAFMNLIDSVLERQEQYTLSALISKEYYR